ncbi:CGNR zinc finger domain-containing protein [Streptomyces nogalater]
MEKSRRDSDAPGTRKWCGMNTCGNREKKARFLVNKRNSWQAHQPELVGLPLSQSSQAPSAPTAPIGLRRPSRRIRPSTPVRSVRDTGIFLSCKHRCRSGRLRVPLISFRHNDHPLPGGRATRGIRV